VEEQIGILTAALLVVAAAAGFGPRIRVPAPLILVAVGIGVSLLPALQSVDVDPQLVLTGILPPLLYASSVSMPAGDLRREFGAVSLLSIVLVIVSALLLGWLFTLLIPGLPYALGVALGAVISPTDSVATSIVKQAKVSHRVTAILEGEGLLNDASALVLLRTALAGAASISVIGVAQGLAWSLLVAVVIGVLVGRLTTALRGRVKDPTVNTVISFAVPFLASLPAEAAGASGLVAAVAAGLVVGRRAPRVLSAEHRRSDAENWRAVSLLLEGAIFLLMGLEIPRIVNAGGGAGRAIWIAVAAFVGLVVIRAAFVTPLLLWLGRRRTHGETMRSRLEQMQKAIANGEPIPQPPRRNGSPRPPRPNRRPRQQREIDRFTRRIRQVLGDIDYLAASPLGPREGVVVIWAGMRGAVTVAAAQTIPMAADPERQPLLVLVAFAVAALSLLLQGGTLSLLIRVLKPRADDPVVQQQEHDKVLLLVQEASDGAQRAEGESKKQWGLRRVKAARTALLSARDEGVFSSDVISGALESLDATEIAIDLRGGPQD
jgi:NhaP-type Na+/H+ or K+/H+ antiporter